MSKSRPLPTFVRQNALSLVLFGLFVAFIVGLALTGYIEENESLAQHGRAPIPLGTYLASGEFAEAVFENWESEFLQMWALVMLTIVFKQKGAPTPSGSAARIRSTQVHDIPL